VRNGNADTWNAEPLNDRESWIAISPGPNPLFHLVM
jgi:hypothetical protein